MVDLLVEGLTVIVGPSNIGKSALIRAATSAFYGRAGDEFVRKGTSDTSVQIYSAPKIGGGTIDIEWHKGKGINKFVIDGVTYDKVARDVPAHLPKAGYHEIQVGDDYIRPQVSEQFDRMFLLDRSGSFVHDVIAQASRLSVLLRAERACSTDLKRQKGTLKIRNTDLLEAQQRLEQMAPIRQLHTRIQAIKPKIMDLRRLSNRLEDLKEMALTRQALRTIANITLPVSVEIAKSMDMQADRIQEIQRLSSERKLYLHLPEAVPSARPYDYDGMLKITGDIETAKKLADERVGALRDYRNDQTAFKSISQELEVAEAELASALAGIDICPVCERPMPGKEVHVHA
jgi:DNA repair exonuclease SbcCD ATPase subunit